MQSQTLSKQKLKRIEKELLLLRNLPKEYKLGKRETPLGTLLYLEIDRAAINCASLDKSFEKLNFDILLKDQFPFIPPQILTRTNFSQPTLADGRDLLQDIIAKEWTASMNLYELIQSIPDFISHVLREGQKRKEEGEEDKEGERTPQMYGRFYVGQVYDMNIWLSNQFCIVFPCQIDPEADSNAQAKSIYVVVTEQVFLTLEPDQKLKNLAKLSACATLPSLEQIKRNLDNSDKIVFVWRRLEKEAWVLPVVMQNGNECVNHIQKRLKERGFTINKNYEKKEIKELQKPQNSSGVTINVLLDKIKLYESAIEKEPQSVAIQHLIMLYNKAIEYYSALNDDKHLEYLEKLQNMFQDQEIQKMMDLSDQGHTPTGEHYSPYNRHPNGNINK